MTRQLVAPIIAPPDLADWAADLHRQGRSIVFTNGCFDLLHQGHLESFQLAATQGHELLVAVNADATVGQLKGRGRPLVPDFARAALLASLRAVTAVTIFAEPTPLETIELVRPDVLVKGSEYAEEDIVGAPEVRAWGGRVYRVPMRAGWSTSQLIAAIKQLP